MNRLNQTHSPYLLQHAANPVHWQPWDDAALAHAKREDKPILLSVGYAACHWCHVMEHESFTDEPTAALMNAHFVNIKVDREERPDLDRIYQAAHYVFRQSPGGWPLTMFLTPDGVPFFGGTYFPKQARRGLTAFSDVLRRITKAWQEQRDAIRQQNEKVLPLLQQLDKTTPADGALSDAPIAAAVESFEQMFDPTNGGFGDAPKFPHPVELSFCLDMATRQNNAALLTAVQSSLQKIADSGLFDHLGGGFFRYCVDAGWRIPHFEKMLYDNGLLLSLLANAQTASPALRLPIEKTAQWLMTDMRDTDDCFYASLDADTAEGEGAFYLWTQADISALLSADEYAVFAAHYGLGTGIDIEGKTHLTRRQTATQTAAATGLPLEQSTRLLISANDKLLTAREKRLKPATDDKILTAWNGLLICGLARAGRLCERDDWIATAQTAFIKIRQRMQQNGRTLASGRQDQVSTRGFLDDCAFLLEAALELLRCRFTVETLNHACSLAAELQTHFEDTDGGGFFFTANDAEALIRRLKVADDNAIPSGNGVAARALLSLSLLTGEINLQHAAHNTLRAFYASIRQMPTGCASLLTALQHFCHPPTVVLLYGEAALCSVWQKTLETPYNPDVLVYSVPAGATGLPEVLDKPAPQNAAVAYVCHGNACLPPIDNLTDLTNTLAQKR